MLICFNIKNLGDMILEFMFTKDNVTLVLYKKLKEMCILNKK